LRPQCLLLFLAASSDLQMTAKNELSRYQWEICVQSYIYILPILRPL
jgi:hypothetical protein